MTITVYGLPGGPRVGRSRFVIAFSDTATHRPIDVGTVAADGTMTMPGMAMTAGLDARRLSGVGQYELEGEYKMGGAWTFTISWNGSHGSGRTTFDLEVQ
jgi:hypothetical protein